MCNALVPLAPTRQKAADPSVSRRPNADFVAQLIATATQAPQTRARRRAAADEVSAVYLALDRLPSPAGRVLSRSL